MEKRREAQVFNINMQEHKPLRELVYEELRLLIMTGELKPGTRMMESSWLRVWASAGRL